MQLLLMSVNVWNLRIHVWCMTADSCAETHTSNLERVGCAKMPLPEIGPVGPFARVTQTEWQTLIACCKWCWCDATSVWYHRSDCIRMTVDWEVFSVAINMSSTLTVMMCSLALP